VVSVAALSTVLAISVVPATSDHTLKRSSKGDSEETDR
jgi:hypothetical protein